jgi:hypothetical protein
MNFSFNQIDILFFYHRFAHLNPSPSISSINPSDDNNDSISSNIPKSHSLESLMNTSSVILKYMSLIEEVHISSIVSRRGYLNFMEEKGTSWMKKFVVC